MSEKAPIYTQQTAAGEIQATSMDLLRAIAQLVERPRPSVDDLVAAVTHAWAEDTTPV